MSRKRNIVSLGLVVLVGGLLFFSFRQPNVLRQPVNPTLSSTASLYIDFDDGQMRNWLDIPLVTGATAFSILKDVQVPIVYDPSTGAGVFIRQIGDKKNGDGGRYWQYWVNDKFALVAADTYALQQGDRVEWKFATEQKE